MYYMDTLDLASCTKRRMKTTGKQNCPWNCYRFLDQCQLRHVWYHHNSMIIHSLCECWWIRIFGFRFGFSTS